MELPWLQSSKVPKYGIVVLGIIGALIVIQLIRAVLQASFSPLKKVPGPFLARYSRLWEFFRAAGGELHWKTVELHEKYGLPLSRQRTSSGTNTEK